MATAAEQTFKQSKETKGLLRSYITGFVLSVVLTLVPYFMVINHVFATDVLLTVIILFALVQLIVQLVYFLHMRQEAKPRINLLIFLSFFSIILIIVIASIWIMQNLNYHMNMLQMQEVMQHGEGF